MRSAVTFAILIVTILASSPSGSRGDTVAFSSDPSWTSFELTPDGQQGSLTGPAECQSWYSYPLDLSSIPGACWIWKGGVTAESPADGQGVVFSRTIQVPGTPESAGIQIAVDDRAEIWANGHFVGAVGSTEDYAIAVAGQAALASFDLTPLIIPGTNVITIVAENGPSEFSLGACDPCTFVGNPAGVVFGGTIEFDPSLPITLGTSWDGISLQDVLDDEYGPGAINVETDYEGYLPGDGDPAWWQDTGLTSLLVREIAGFENANRMGWYLETLGGAPVIDGVDDGVIFDGPVIEGSEVFLEFPQDTRFGLYLNPNGPNSSYFAPEPEMFFTNRFYNDIGPDGSGAIHAPFDGDVQALIFNITHLRGGVPTYVVAWEDIDSGAPILPTWSTLGTDNDYNDLVVEISAFSPVKIQNDSWGAVKAMFQR